MPLHVLYTLLEVRNHLSAFHAVIFLLALRLFSYCSNLTQSNSHTLETLLNRQQFHTQLFTESRATLASLFANRFTVLLQSAFTLDFISCQYGCRFDKQDAVQEKTLAGTGAAISVESLERIPFPGAQDP